ncbi:MAG: cation:proton antiporter [Desulfobacteraceae bacterium]
MTVIVAVMMVCGLIFLTGGAVGIIRFPDFYTRLHPAGKLDTGGSLFILGALALFNLYAHGLSLEALLISIKISLILVFIFFSIPTAIHGIVDAGMRAGLRPWTRGEKRR